MEKVKKKRSFLYTFLKVIIIILFVIAVLLIGGYLTLKYSLGIDIIDLKRKVELLNTSVSESEVVTEPFNDEDAVSGFTLLMGGCDFYTTDGTSYTFNKEIFETYEGKVSGEIVLSSKQLASCTNVFLTNYLVKDLTSDEIAVDTSIKQISFSNFVLEDNNIKVDTKTILKIDLFNFKQKLAEYNNFISNFILRYIPSNIYITTEAEIVVDTVSNTSIITPESILINNLSQSQSQEVLNLISKFSGENNNNFLNDIATQFLNFIFSYEEDSFLKKIRVNSFTFVKGEDEIINIVLN